MKNRKILFTFASLAILTAMVAITSCTNNNSDFRKQKVNTYYLTNEGLSLIGKTYYYRIKNSTVPYRSITDFVADYLLHPEESGLANFKVETKDGISIVTNLSSNGKAIINYTNQTITYPDLTAYYNESSRTDVPVGCDFAGDKYFIGKPESTRTNPQQSVVKLDDYHVHAYYINGEGYVPETFMVQALVPLINVGLVFNGRNCYALDGAAGTSEAFQKGLAQIRNTATIFNKEYMEYNYNVLAFMFDFRFGLTGQKHINRNPNAYEESHTFFKDGAYATLEKYKNDLCSTDLDKTNAALAKIAQDELCDGGHSTYLCHDIFSTVEGAASAAIKLLLCTGGAHEVPTSYENFYTSLLARGKLLEARQRSKANPTIMTGDPNAKAGFQIYPNANNSGKVAYLVFDSFVSAEETGGPDKPVDINANNYYDNTLSLVYWADKQLKANADVKDIVIDLSCNGGGNVYVEQFIASWLCGGVSKLNLYNRHDKTLRTVVRHADVNLDGKFDNSDYLSSDYNVYCLFSNSSFSCGNLLPCDLKDHTVPTLHLLGTKTGGGCCSVESGHFNALGGNLILSSLYTLCREESTATNVVTVENGVEGDFAKYSFNVGDELLYPGKFFAVDNIINAILSE